MFVVVVCIRSWWAYYELGWGGWWFWDPVENASFMPWLVATALVHSTRWVRSERMH
jgi:cytochrome c-type biogenesis protein CcmF